MAKVTYLGPGDSLEIDGVVLDKGQTVDLLPEQVVRLRADATVQLQVEDEPDTQDSRDRIRESQDKHRSDRASAASEAAEPKATRRQKGKVE